MIGRSINNKSFNKISSNPCILCFACCLGSIDGQGIDADSRSSSFSLVVEGKVNLKLGIRHSRRVDEQAIEKVQVGRCPLSAVDSGLRAAWEGGLQERLHLGGVGKGESGAGLESDEDVVGVDVDCSDLRQCGRSGSNNWRICVCCGIGRRSDRSGSRPAN